MNLKELFIPPPIGLLVPTYIKSLQVKYIQGLLFFFFPTNFKFKCIKIFLMDQIGLF